MSRQRVVGLDLGSRRVGIAVSDPSGTVASPHGVIERSGDVEADRAAIAALVDALGAARVIVGLPISLDGTTGPAARAAQQEAEALSALVAVPVETHDERLTTVTAERVLVEHGVRTRARRRAVDKIAAAVMLQSWLDANRG
jgi:putative Holliday junction resolvase